MNDKNFTAGWDIIEQDDTGRNFRWGSKNCSLFFENLDNKRFLYFNIGTAKSKKIIIYYPNVEKYDIIAKELIINPGWHYYKIPINLHDLIQEQDKEFVENIYFNNIRFECIDYISEDRDFIKELAFQASDFFIDDDIKFNVYKPEKLKSKFIDIIYILHQEKRTRLTIETQNRKDSVEIYSGGERSVSYEIHDEDFNEDFELKLLSTGNVDVKSIINRENYFDFLGLEQLKDEESENNLKRSIQVANTIPLAIQWFVTWKCNMKCGYCWQESAKSIYRKLKSRFDIPVEQWAEKINKIRPRKIYFTGGEPSLFKGLPLLTNLIDNYTRFDMTSNFGKTFILDEWKDVDFSRWDYCAFSIHPTQWDHPDDFFNKLEEFFTLKNVHKNRIGIEMVLHPDNLKLVDPQRIIDFSNEHGLVDPHLDNFVDSNVPSMDGDEVLDQKEVKIESISNSYKLENLTDIKGRKPTYCAAGMRRINIDSDGNVFTCMSAIDRSKLFDYSAMPHYQPIGNIFDDNFKLNERPVLCWESFRCSACDYDTLDVSWFPFKENFNFQLPIVE